MKWTDGFLGNALNCGEIGHGDKNKAYYESGYLKMSMDFADSTRFLYKCIASMPLYTIFYVNQYCQVLCDSLLKCFTHTLNELTVTKGITAMSFRVEENFSASQQKRLFEILSDFPVIEELQDRVFLTDVESFLVHSFEGVLIEEHVMCQSRFQSMIILLKNSIWLSSLAADIFERINELRDPENVDCHDRAGVLSGLVRPIPLALKPLVFEAISDQVVAQLEKTSSDIFRFTSKCLTLCFFEIRFKIACLLQSLFEKDVAKCVPSSVHLLHKYVGFAKSALKALSVEASDFFFLTLPNFIHWCLIRMAKKNSDIRKRASSIRRSLFFLVSLLSQDPYFDLSVLKATISFFELFEFELDDIIKSVSTDGPLFSFETYSIVINALKESSLSAEAYTHSVKAFKEIYAISGPAPKIC